MVVLLLDKEALESMAYKAALPLLLLLDNLQLPGARIPAQLQLVEADKGLVGCNKPLENIPRLLAFGYTGHRSASSNHRGLVGCKVGY